MDAGPLVKVVMGLLLGASIFSWTIILQRLRYFKKRRQKIINFNKAFSGEDLVKLYSTLQTRTAHLTGIEKIFFNGFREFLLAKKRQNIEPNLAIEPPAIIAERVIEITIDQELLKLNRDLSTLATIGSVSPYVGLFGTVWGIMTSFRALSGLQQASIAMVAPGISEALIATAIGLFAAIPAVIMYNYFVNQAAEIADIYSITKQRMVHFFHQQA